MTDSPFSVSRRGVIDLLARVVRFPCVTQRSASFPHWRRYLGVSAYFFIALAIDEFLHPTLIVWIHVTIGSPVQLPNRL
jgi:hypothetical protein